MRTRTKIFIIILALLNCNSVNAQTEININKIIQIESSGNPRAYNPKSGARGLMQITPICLAGYNYKNKTNLSVDDLWIPAINKEVGVWYLKRRIPQMLKYYGIADTVENRLIAYNWGIGHLRQFIHGLVEVPTETRRYIRDYYK